jgi:hypothetical protein
MGLAVASLVMSGVGALVQMNAARQQADAQSRADQYQAAVAQQNQQIANQYAAMETARGEQLAQQKQTETAQRVGAVTATAGANGLDTGSGSALRLTNDTYAMGDLDARTIRYNAQKAAYGYQVQGTSYGNQANLDMMAANDASNAGNLGAFSAIINGGASVSDKWLRYKQVGALG